MMPKFLFSLILLCMSTVFAVAQQSLVAVDDYASTGPLQKVRVNVLANDTLTCTNYTLVILSTLDAVTQGTAKVVKGGFIDFIPGAGCRNSTVTIAYGLTCNKVQVKANLTVKVTAYNRPVNEINEHVDCYENMPSNITFDIRKKYEISPKASADNWIDAMVSPLVGDLNSDGKPEIVIMGNTGNNGEAAYTYMKYINIYNGQTGERICRHNFADGNGGYGEMSIGGPWHRPPSTLALADLDGDGIGEIVFCHSNNGRVTAFKPIFYTDPVTLTKMWEGHAGSTIVNYKSPVNNSDDDIYGYPHPYIADLNGDGNPEVIVYNKIFNGVTGDLLMSWQGGTATLIPKVSNYTSTSGLQERNPNPPVSKDNADNIRNVAMTGRRPASAGAADRYLAVPAIVDIDGDGQQEIITGNRIHKFNFKSLTDHTQNTYYTIEGPQSVEVSESSGKVRYWLSDGFTRVADIDGDGQLDIIVTCFGNEGAGGNVKIIVYVWDMNDLNNVKACVSFRSNGDGASNFSIPFIGDINGNLDGYDSNTSSWTKKLPEICILSGNVFISRSNRDTANNATVIDRTGIKFHPKTNLMIRRGVGWNNNNTSAGSRRFNRLYNSNSGNISGHIIGLTWDATATEVEDKLKISWGMEHDDVSANTGITLFDFDNDNAADLCYRDARTLRVISPKKSGKDYVELNETVGAGSSIMFKTNVYSATAFEYPVIADVNMDGSADIVVTNSGVDSRSVSRGWIEVYEYGGKYKWAPCPPVWNQGMYDPAQVSEDLKINACPMPMLTPYTKNGETIYPYNGSWMQVPIVRKEQDFVPVVRQPDAVMQDVRVKVINAAQAEITVDVFNRGSATLASNTPISFYNGGVNGLALKESSFIKTVILGVDLFPNEKITRTYTLTGSNYNKCLMWANIMANNKEFPAAGFDDCNLTNNSFAGIDCPYLSYSVTASSTAICGNNGTVMLKAIPATKPQHTPIYQWYKDEMIISGATNQIYFASTPGVYKCYVIENICRGYSSSVTITLNADKEMVMPKLVTLPADGKLCNKGNILLKVDNFKDYTGGTYIWIKDGMPFDTTAQYYINIPNRGILQGNENGSYQVFVISEKCGVLSEKNNVKISTDEVVAPLIAKIPATAVICGSNGSVKLQITNTSAITGASFRWYRDGIPIANAADSYYFVGLAGSYSVNVNSDNGCSTFSNNIKIDKIAEESPVVVAPKKVYVGETANLLPSTGGTWTSSNPAIATVDNKGLIAGLAEGKALFTYVSTSGCVSVSDTVQVEKRKVKAFCDTVLLLFNDIVKFDALANDMFNCSRNQLIVDTVAKSGLRKGSLTINDDQTFTYKPVKNTFGIDSVEYSIEYGTDIHNAKIYFIISKSLSLHNVACPQTQMPIGMYAIANVQYYWYSVQTGGSPLQGSPTNSITITKDDSNEQIWYVGVKYKGSNASARYRISVLKSDNCGTVNPVGCAVSGQLLFREDFGGNSASNPRISTTALPAGVTEYVFQTTDRLRANQYALVKYIDPASNYAWQKDFSDHTNPKDKNKGYMFLVDAAENPGKFYETRITGLCDNIHQLYFSVWIANVIPTSNTAANDNPILKFELLDDTDNVIGTYVTSSVPKDPLQSVKWRNYGFMFDPKGYNSLKLKIYNNKAGSNGNDFAMDDIEIRLCLPAIKIETVLSDTVCPGSSHTFKASYQDDGTFTSLGNKLAYRWQYSAVNDPQAVWTTVKEGTSNSSTLNATFTINNITVANKGYYRLLIANSSTIDHVNCRNMSNSVYLHVFDKLPKPAISSLYGNYNLCGSVNTLTLKVTNPEKGLSYQWYKDTAVLASETKLSLKVNASGLYKIQATDLITGCSGYADTTITQDLNINFPDPVISSVSGGTAICGKEGSVFITLSNRSAYSADAVYQWYKNGQIIANATSVNYNATTSGEYYIVVKDKTCLAVSATITITDANSGTNITKPVLKSENNLTVLCSSGSSLRLYVDNAKTFTSGAVYVWYRNEREVSRGENKPNYIATDSGKYKVLIYETGGCSSLSKEIELKQSGGSGITKPQIISESGTAVICGDDGGIMLKLTTSYTGKNIHYQWFKGDTLLVGANGIQYYAKSSGSYSVLVGVDSCSAQSDKIKVTKDTKSTVVIPVLKSENNLTVLCSSGSSLRLYVDNAKAFTSGAVYVWYRNEREVSRGENKPNYIATDSGKYKVLIYETGGCSSLSKEIELKQSGG
ncbi:MAG: Ig-like domain-containing protein, partial [Prevotellaceae bacterium]|nr:Ig-like domain-containing protein [Prevotellaceae bacterium]